MANHLPQTSIPAPPAEERSDYAAVSLLAVAGLIVGVFSAVAVVDEPLLWILPAFGAGLSLAGLVRVTWGDPPKIGRRVALAGLGLSVIFGVAGPVRYVFRESQLQQRARTVADAWCEHVRAGRFYHAHQLTYPVDMRNPLNDVLDKLYETDVDTQESFRKFAERAPMDVLATHREGLKFHFVRSTFHVHDRDQDSFGELYAVELPPGSTPAKMFVQLMLLRSTDLDTGEEQWQVKYIYPGDKVAE